MLDLFFITINAIIGPQINGGFGYSKNGIAGTKMRVGKTPLVSYAR